MNSSILVCNSALTVCISSLSDCNSSLELLSSSLVLCNSSLLDWQLLVGRPQFLAGGLHLLDRALEALRVRRSSSSNSLGGRAASAERRGGRRFPRRLRLLEHHQQQVPQGVALGKRPDDEIDGRPTAVGPDLDALARKGGPPRRGVVQGDAQRLPQPLAGHRKDVHVDFSRGRLQVLPRPRADVEDVSLGIDDDGGRAVEVQHARWVA